MDWDGLGPGNAGVTALGWPRSQKCWKCGARGRRVRGVYLIWSSNLAKDLYRYETDYAEVTRDVQP